MQLYLSTPVEAGGFAQLNRHEKRRSVLDVQIVFLFQFILQKSCFSRIQFFVSVISRLRIFFCDLEELFCDIREFLSKR